jgi:hypothetical protein
LACAAAALAAPAQADSWETTPPTTPFAPGSAPADNAQTVINNFQSSGYRVILNRVGSLSLDQCTVTAVSPGQAVTTPVTGGAKAINQQVLFTTVYLTADCTHPVNRTSSSSGSS